MMDGSEEDDPSGQTSASGTMISKLCADARVVRDGLQRLQRDARQSCEAFQREGDVPADSVATLLSLSAASAHASAAESSISAMVDALNRAAASLPHQPAEDIGASAAAAAAVAMEAASEEPGAESSMVEEEAARTPSFRLTHTSGRPPTNDGPPARRLSRDELSGVFGFYQPWELTPVAPTIGKTLVGWAAQQYTHLTIDGSERGGVHQLWEGMPLEVAYRWGRRATNLAHLHLIYPRAASLWCRGIWVAILEGNAAARKATRERREEGQAEDGAAAAAAAGASRQDGPSAASSIKVLSFEKAVDGEPYAELNDVSADPLPPFPSPVDLSALEEVHRMPHGCAAVRTGGRVWHTPLVRVMTFESDDGDDEVEAAKEWMTSCEHLEVFDDGNSSTVDKVQLLSVPPPGTSLARLQSIGTLGKHGWDLYEGNADAMRDVLASMREALLALLERGCRRSLSELPIAVEGKITTGHKGVLRELARLSEAVLQPQALDKPQFKIEREGEMELELIEWMANESSQVQKLVREFAALAGVVLYENELTDAADTVYFPRATIFRCPPRHLSAEVIDGLARTVANSMPQCRTIEFVDTETHLDAAKNAVVFLKALKRHMATGEGQGGSSSGSEGERRLSVKIEVSAGCISDRSRPLQGWTSHDLPAIDDVHLDVKGGLPAGATEEVLNGSLMASLAGIMSRPGVRKASASLHRPSLRQGVRRLFNTQLAGLSLLGAPNTITMGHHIFTSTITVARRT
ncbi:unnamed protein product [Vitrella brassicaformis CCMP3155]|uniref:Uncharacterized protein n=1 Tax=Vitrella brassicaformis (strain CCMP3155) TaxID=1169540 RepID=A0A0G4GPR1_VITBC|nr:unnamed protein product [Vitrella brassicaformis CCMP3155]|eukprot:CEM32333.1 unnamed protein product [Vitrella brassicaformis CCMP3155]